MAPLAAAPLGSHGGVGCAAAGTACVTAMDTHRSHLAPRRQRVGGCAGGPVGVNKPGFLISVSVQPNTWYYFMAVYSRTAPGPSTSVILRFRPDQPLAPAGTWAYPDRVPATLPFISPPIAVSAPGGGRQLAGHAAACKP